MTHGKPIDRKRFDYIVIGGGSAGAVLACGLAENRRCQVLLVEAGSRVSNRNVRVPALYPFHFRDPRFCDSRWTVPQPALSNRRIFLPSGRGLGGSSLINAMIWLPPHSTDLATWSRFSGGAWDVNEMERHIQSLNDIYFGPEAELNDGSPSNTGETHCPNSMTTWVSPIVNEFLEHSTLSGFNLYPYQRTVKNGRRLSAWNAFRERPLPANLSIIRGCKVHRVVMGGSVATGVVVGESGGGGDEMLLADQGVILCSGALASPELLQRSGIGPQEVLREAGVEVIVPSNQIGENLQDHLLFPIVMEQVTAPFPSRPDKSLLREAVLSGTGPLTSNIAEAGGLFHFNQNGEFNWDGAEASLAEPQFQWHITPTHYLEYPTRENSKSALSIGITPLHPKSRGSVYLTRDEQRNLTVRIDPAYLNEASDKMEFVRAIQRTRNWLNQCSDETKPMSWSCTSELLPGSKRSSDEQVASSVSRYATTLYHYVGTCAVGKHESYSACTADFRVRGADQLYVCDASVLPSLPSGNTQVAVMMLAKMLLQRLV